MENTVKNIFTVDLEDWFYSHEYNNAYDKAKKNELDFILQDNIKTILNMLKEADCTATFFTLGAIAESLPGLINEILDKGHEIASHGYDHKFLSSLKENNFSEDLEKTNSAIYKASGVFPIGYRAPCFVIYPWIFKRLKSFGFIYDSSFTQRGLIQNQEHFKDILQNSEMYQMKEFPLNSFKILNMYIPCSGGGYFRFYPYPVFRYLFKNSVNSFGMRIFYIHPWELNNSIDKKLIKGIPRLKNFYGISSIKNKLGKLFEDFEFISFEKFLEIKQINLR